LSQLAMLLFVFPTSYIPEWQINEMLLMLIGIIIFNSCLFILAYKDVIRSKTILYLTYIMGFSISFYIAINPFFPFHIGDRKSTRLNSSHVSISYAVFCLKKK